MEHINLLRKIAWSFHKTTKLDFNDLFQEAYLAYVYARQKYDPDKGVKETAFIWIHVSNQLKSYYQNEKNFTYPMDNAYRKDRKAYDLLTYWKKPQSEDQNDFLESLSSDAYEVASLVLITPSKFLRLEKRKDIYDKITKIMKKRGWENNRIRNTINELSLVCSDKKSKSIL